MTARLGEVATPALLVEAPRMRANVARMATDLGAAGVALRPHWKTSKSAEIGRLQLDAGAVGLTCVTDAELFALVEAGVDDVFWAYPPIGDTRIGAAVEAARRIALRVGVDSVAAARGLSARAAETEAGVDVLLEIDTGLARTGVAPGDAVAVAGELAALPGLRLVGVYTHEGHVGAVPGTPADRAEAARTAGAALVAAAESVRAAGLDVPVVSVGSTPGAAAAPFVAGVTEARPGTYVLGDDNQHTLGSIPPEGRALSVLCTVISRHRDGHVIVDAGLKSMAADSSIRGDGRLGTTEDGSAWLSTANEEHGFLTGPGVAALQVGDRLRLVPNHACGTVNMWSTLTVVDGDDVIGAWPVLARH